MFMGDNILCLITHYRPNNIGIWVFTP